MSGQRGNVIRIHIAGTSPYGFRLVTNNEQQHVVTKLRAKGKAAIAGLLDGDILLAVNGYNCQGLRHDRISSLIEHAGHFIDLDVCRNSGTNNYFSNDYDHDIINSDSLHDYSTSCSGLTSPTSFDYVTNTTNRNQWTSSPSIDFEMEIPSWRSPSPPGNGYKPLHLMNRTDTGRSASVAAVRWNPDRSVTMSLDFDVTDKENLVPAHRPIVHRNEAFLQLTDPHPRQPVAPPVRSQSLDPFRSQGRRLWNDTSSDIIPPVSRLAPLPPEVVKIITPGKDADRIPDELLNKKKKVFADSAFYSDPGHNYPTVEEQRKMAHKVAQSLTASINQQTRGHQMFMKRKEKHDENDDDVTDHVTNMQNDSGGNGNLYYNPTPWKSVKQWKRDGSDHESVSSGHGVIRPRSATPSSRVYTVASIIPDCNLPDESSTAMSADEFERFRLFADKSRHSSVPPQVCFSLASDLRDSNSKGARMFAKRRARADQFTVENSPTPQQATLDKIVQQNHQKLSTYQRQQQQQQQQPPAVNSQSFTGSWTHVEPQQQKSRWTPWDAAMEFSGNVEPAFEHLNSVQTFGRTSSITGSDKSAPASPRHQTPILSPQQASVQTSPDSIRRSTFNWSSPGGANGYRPVNSKTSVR